MNPIEFNSTRFLARRLQRQEQLIDTGMLSLVDLPSPEKDTLWATQDRWKEGVSHLVYT
jgi:hypothetical protein